MDHWATLLPVQRDGIGLRHVFEDCAHWWALARHCLIALDTIHELQIVHLDLKADNVCIPFDPPDFDPLAPGQSLRPRFEQIALIDFAFSLVSGESLTRALPIACRHDHDYQSPRLLQALEAGSRGDLLPTRQLDWRCDVFSLAAMLRRYLPDPEAPLEGMWTPARHAQARALVRRLLEAHDAERPSRRPHQDLLALIAHTLDDDELAASLARDWTLAIDSKAASEGWQTPVTRVAMPVSVDPQHGLPAMARLEQAQQGRLRARRVAAALAVVSVAAIGVPLLYDAWSAAHRRDAADAHSARPVPPTSERPGTEVEADAMPARARTPSSEAVTAAAASPMIANEVAAVAAPASAPAPAPVAAPVLAKAPARAAVPVPRSPAAVVKRGPEATGTAVLGAGARARPEARAARPPPARTAPPMSERERALAWLTMRGPAPRSAARSGPTAEPAVAPSPSPVADARSPVGPAAPAWRGAAWSAPMPAPAAAPESVSVQAPMQMPAASPVTALAPGDFAVRASQLMTTDLPRVVQRVEQRVLRVMDMAAQPDSAWRDEQVRRAADAIRDHADEPLHAGEFAADDARQLHERASQAYRRAGDARAAHALQLKAFGANPFDPVIATSLAYLSLQQSPPQADMARQMALYSLSLRHKRHPGGRIEDWTTLAIASALSGRDRDARNAWFVSLALAPQPERQCRAAVDAYAKHGERVRSSIEAMLHRAQASGRTQSSALCEWPPFWLARRQMR